MEAKPIDHNSNSTASIIKNNNPALCTVVAIAAIFFSALLIYGGGSLMYLATPSQLPLFITGAGISFIGILSTIFPAKIIKQLDPQRSLISPPEVPVTTGERVGNSVGEGEMGAGANNREETDVNTGSGTGNSVEETNKKKFSRDAKGVDEEEIGARATNITEVDKGKISGEANNGTEDTTEVESSSEELDEIKKSDEDIESEIVISDPEEFLAQYLFQQAKLGELSFDTEADLKALKKFCEDIHRDEQKDYVEFCMRKIKNLTASAQISFLYHIMYLQDQHIFTIFKEACFEAQTGFLNSTPKMSPSLIDDMKSHQKQEESPGFSS